MSQNLFSEEVVPEVTLEQLNAEKASTYYGAVVFLCILILPGIIGNAHVLHIYTFKKPNNNTRVLVIVLAAIDLLACFVGFPSAMVNYLHPLTLYMDAGCKFFTHLTCSLAIGEVLMLLAIAVERYRKICKPFKPQFTVKHTKIVCALIIMFSVISTSPVLYLYGSTDRPTRHVNITGNGCNVKLELRQSVSEKVFNGITLCMSITMCIVLVVLYALIVVKVWQHQVKMNKRPESTTTHVLVCKEREQTNVTDQSQRQEIKGIINEKSDREPIGTIDQSQRPETDIAANEINSNEPRKSDQSQCQGNPTINRDDNTHKQDKDSNQTLSQNPVDEFNVMRSLHKSLKKKQGTLTKTERIRFQQIKKPMYMFMWITVFYLVSYIPYPALLLYRTFNADSFDSLSHSGLVVFHLAVSLVFLNNVVNSFIYMIFDVGYRSELKLFYTKLFCRQRQQSYP